MRQVSNHFLGFSQKERLVVSGQLTLKHSSGEIQGGRGMWRGGAGVQETFGTDEQFENA